MFSQEKEIASQIELERISSVCDSNIAVKTPLFIWFVVAVRENLHDY